MIGPEIDRSVSQHLHLLRALRAEISSLEPGIFTAGMLWINVKGAFPEITENEVRQLCSAFVQEGSLAEVGWIRQGHVDVPAYRFIDAN